MQYAFQDEMPKGSLECQLSRKMAGRVDVQICDLQQLAGCSYAFGIEGDTSKILSVQQLAGLDAAEGCIGWAVWELGDTVAQQEATICGECKYACPQMCSSQLPHLLP